MEFPLVERADGSNLREQMDILKDQAAIQASLYVLEEQANRNRMTFSQDKCKVLPPGRKHPCSSQIGKQLFGHGSGGPVGS